MLGIQICIMQHLYYRHYHTMLLHNRTVMLDSCTIVALCDDAQNQPTNKKKYTVLLNKPTILNTCASPTFVAIFHQVSWLPRSCHTVLAAAAGGRLYVSLRYRSHERVLGRSYLVNWPYIHHIFVDNGRI